MRNAQGLLAMIVWFVLSACLSGCAAVGLAGMMAESARLSGSTRVPAEYTGLEGKSYAVIVSADRLIEADHAGITARLTEQIGRDLYANAGGSAHIPPAKMLGYLYANPQWPAIPRGQLGETLGVERLIVVELVDYRLHEPGNRYTWSGLASGVVEVYEIDSGLPDDPMFEYSITVQFPDRAGILEEELQRIVVTSELSRRFAQRVAWLFYGHEERNDLTY
jgi:hypothetical protein